MKFRKIISLLIWIPLLMSPLANSGIILDTDSDSFIDVSTNLEWMDFGINNGQSYNYVSSQIVNGGEYDGWSLATEKQVYTLWTNAYLGLGADTELVYKINNGEDYIEVFDEIRTDGSVLKDIAESMGVNQIGWNTNGFDHRYSFGMFDRAGFLGSAQLGTSTGSSCRGADLCEGVLYMVFADPLGHIDESWKELKRLGYSTMLVRSQNTDIPEPSMLTIFFMSLLGLALSQKPYKS